MATVLEVAAARIAALDASAWEQGSKVTPAWHESKVLIRADVDDLEESAFGHLAFSVFVDDAPGEEQRFQAMHCASVEPVLVVAFLYRLRVGSQVVDQQAAWGAASQVVAALCPDWNTQVEATAGTTLARTYSRVENAGRAKLSADASWLIVRQQYRLTYELPIGVPFTAPVNSTIPTIQGTIAADEVIRLYPGTWTGTAPISYVYSLLLGGVEVASGAVTVAGVPYTLPGDFDDEVLLLEVTATNGSGSTTAESQPIGVP
jgi:hypothetical protein